MDPAKAIISSNDKEVTLEDVNRLLDLGRLLLSVLSPEEINTIQSLIHEASVIDQIGNTGDS